VIPKWRSDRSLGGRIASDCIFYLSDSSYKHDQSMGDRATSV
jgi:hypothetical protein